MAWNKSAENRSTQALRTIALRYPEANEGIACKGTAVEGPRFDARNKAFLFLRLAGDSYIAMLKLGDSQAEAAKLGAREPGRYKVGSGGWTTVIFKADDAPLGVLERWIDESYRLVAPRQLVAMLPASAPQVALSKKKTDKAPGANAANKTARKRTASAKRTASR